MRLPTHAARERNFHIFYEMLAATAGDAASAAADLRSARSVDSTIFSWKARTAFAGSDISLNSTNASAAPFPAAAGVAHTQKHPVSAAVVKKTRTGGGVVASLEVLITMCRQHSSPEPMVRQQTLLMLLGSMGWGLVLGTIVSNLSNVDPERDAFTSTMSELNAMMRRVVSMISRRARTLTLE